MKKILFLGAGSTSDPSFEQAYDKEHLEKEGITVLPTVIESCHGCPDLMTKYSKQMQSLVEEGNRVVGVLEGGLLFGLPSIQATQVTYPIISCPLDLIAYTAFMVPSGHACIASVGIEKKLDKENYETYERKKAIMLAKKILDLDEDAVNIIGNGDIGDVVKELKKFDIEVSAKYKDLVLTYDSNPAVRREVIQIWADSKEVPEPSTWTDTLQVKGVKNLAIYAAKILSLQRPDIREKIKEIGNKKRDSYTERDLIKELGGN